MSHLFVIAVSVLRTLVVRSLFVWILRLHWAWSLLPLFILQYLISRSDFAWGLVFCSRGLEVLPS